MIFVRLIHRDSTEKEPSTSAIQLTATLNGGFYQNIVKERIVLDVTRGKGYASGHYHTSHLFAINSFMTEVPII